MPTLSQELIDLMIDFGYWDRGFLANCALVHRDWLPSSRRHHFERIWIHRKNINGWLEIVQNPASTCTQHVRTAMILRQSTEERVSFKEVGDCLIPERMPKLESLEILGASLSDEDASAVDALSFSTVEKLVLSGCVLTGSFEVLYLAISKFTRLSKLTLSDIGMGQHLELTTPTTPYPSHLRSLSIDGGFLEHTLPWAINANAVLSELNIQVREPEELRLVATAIRKAGASLRKLSLDFLEDVCQDALEEMDLSSCSGLVALELHLNNAEFHSFPWLLRWLKSIPGSADPQTGKLGANQMKFLGLVIGWNACGDYEAEMEGVDSDSESANEDSESDGEIAKWDKLESILQSDQFASLQELWLVFSMASAEKDLDDYIRQKCLPECEKRGIIRMGSQDCVGSEAYEAIPY